MSVLLLSLVQSQARGRYGEAEAFFTRALEVDEVRKNALPIPTPPLRLTEMK